MIRTTFLLITEEYVMFSANDNQETSLKNATRREQKKKEKESIVRHHLLYKVGHRQSFRAVVLEALAFVDRSLLQLHDGFLSVSTREVVILLT